VDGFDSADDPKGVSAVPSALLLFNPALNLTRPVMDAKDNDISAKISPTRFLKKSAPPTWLVYGDEDAALAQGREFAAKAKELGVPVELLTAAKQPNGFFNRPPWLESTTLAAEVWLVQAVYVVADQGHSRFDSVAYDHASSGLNPRSRA